MRTLLIVPVAFALVLAAGLPQASAQDDSSQHVAIADGHAEGRFIAFDVGSGGAICDWSFEGRTVIKSMTGVGGTVRSQGRHVTVDGQADGTPSCSASAQVGGTGDGPEDADEADEDEGASSTSTTRSNATGNGSASGSATRTASATRTGSTSAAGDDDQDDDGDDRVATARAKLHDNPNGAIAIDLEAGQTVRLDFAGDVDLDAEGGKVRLRGDDGLRATLFLAKGSGDVDVRASGAAVTLEASAPAKVHFRVEDRDLDEDDGDQFAEHRDDGDVACEVFVSDDDEPDVLTVDGGNVTVVASHTSVRVDLSINVDVDVHVGSDPDGGTVTRTETQGSTQTVTRTQTQTTTVTRTQTADGGAGGSDGGSDGGATHDGCGCAAKVVILDVDVSVFVLGADDDLLVRLDGVLLARADSVEDALTVEAGEDPEALVVVDQQEEVKVLLSLASGESQVTLEAQEGQEFRTREPERRTTQMTTTLEPEDDGLAPVNDIDVGAEPEDREPEAAADSNDAPALGPGLMAVAVVAAAALAARRRLRP